MVKVYSSIALSVMTMLLSACDGDSKEGTEVVECIKSRRDVRVYHDTPVPREDMDIIVSCGLHAPNFMNTQPWEIRIVDNAELLTEMSECMLSDYDSARVVQIKSNSNYRNIFRDAPTVVFIGYKDTGYGEVDCGMLGANMITAAQSMGYGSCVLAGPVRFLKGARGAHFYKRLGFSPDFRLLYAIGFGTPVKQPELRPLETNRVKYID